MDAGAGLITTLTWILSIARNFGTKSPAVEQCPQPSSQAFWVLGCGKPIVVERADPIVYPGVPSEHLHSIMGGDAFNFSMDFSTTQMSKCTTCGVTKDLSNYWVPTVYFRAENDTFINVEQVGGINVYYQSVFSFPKTFALADGCSIQGTDGLDRLPRLQNPSAISQRVSNDCWRPLPSQLYKDVPGAAGHRIYMPPQQCRARPRTVPRLSESDLR
jgi:Domain of unknown function (DUF1996)